MTQSHTQSKITGIKRNGTTFDNSEIASPQQASNCKPPPKRFRNNNNSSPSHSNVIPNGNNNPNGTNIVKNFDNSTLLYHWLSKLPSTHSFVKNFPTTNINSKIITAMNGVKNNPVGPQNLILDCLRVLVTHSLKTEKEISLLKAENSSLKKQLHDLNTKTFQLNESTGNTFTNVQKDLKSIRQQLSILDSGNSNPKPSNPQTIPQQLPQPSHSSNSQSSVDSLPPHGDPPNESPKCKPAPQIKSPPISPNKCVILPLTKKFCQNHLNKLIGHSDGHNKRNGKKHFTKFRFLHFLVSKIFRKNTRSFYTTNRRSSYSQNNRRKNNNNNYRQSNLLFTKYILSNNKKFILLICSNGKQCQMLKNSYQNLSQSDFNHFRIHFSKMINYKTAKHAKFYDFEGLKNALLRKQQRRSNPLTLPSDLFQPKSSLISSLPKDPDSSTSVTVPTTIDDQKDDQKSSQDDDVEMLENGKIIGSNGHEVLDSSSHIPTLTSSSISTLPSLNTKHNSQNSLFVCGRNLTETTCNEFRTIVTHSTDLSKHINDISILLVLRHYKYRNTTKSFIIISSTVPMLIPFIQKLLLANLSNIQSSYISSIKPFVQHVSSSNCDKITYILNKRNEELHQIRAQRTKYLASSYKTTVTDLL